MSTTLNCLSWMQNQKNDQDPCTTAQEIGQLCTPGYNVSLMNFQESNYVPNATTTNGCTCSWSIYNLLSACTYCFGQSQYISWSTWTSSCGSYASSTSYLPSGLSFPNGIPFWAATNPSTWENGTFNLAQAANIAAAAHPDVTGEALPTSTVTASTSSASHTSIGPIIGGVIGAVAIIIIGGLTVFCVVRRRRRQRNHMTSTSVSSLNAFQPVTVPVTSIRNRPSVQPNGYMHTTNPALMSPLTSPISPGLSSHDHSAMEPIADAAEVISPFLLMSPTSQTNRSDMSPPTSKSSEARAKRVVSPTGQRTRMNPPSYSESVQPRSSRRMSFGSRRLSMKKKRNDSVSGATIYSGHSRTSTNESISTILSGTRTERSRPRAGTVESVESEAGGGSSVNMMRGRRAGTAEQRLVAV